MKKYIAAILAVCMAAAVSMPVLAAEPESLTPPSPNTNKPDGSYSLGVTGTYVPSGSTATEVISVDISWETLSFTYTAGGSTYDPSTHLTTSGGGVWSPNRPGITVTNHSNAPIEASMSFAAASGVTTTGRFYTKGEGGTYTAITSAVEQRLDLATAVGTAVDNAPKGTLYFGVSGAPITENKTLGTITVTIAKERWTEVSTNSELQAAIANGGKVKLTADIDAGTNNSQPPVALMTSIKLDLNGHTLSGQSVQAIVGIGEGDYTIKNGKITNTRTGATKAVWTMVGNVTLHLDACILEVQTTVDGSAFTGSGGTIVANDCSFIGQLYGNGRIELSGATTLNGSIDSRLTIIAKAGTYNFDPTAYVDANTYTVTANTDGTWTVAAKTN